MITIDKLKEVQESPTTKLEELIDKHIISTAKEGETDVTFDIPLSVNKDLLESVVEKYTQEGYRTQITEVYSTDLRGDYTISRITSYVLLINWGHLV